MAHAVNASMECWNSAAATDVGQVRKLNEDAYLDRPDLGLWAVADGMGGHASGEVASGMVCESLARLPSACRLPAAVDFIDDSIDEVNSDLVDLALRRGGNVIGSTLVALVARAQYAVVLWAGDSRLYRWRDGELQQLTDDHSLVEEARGVLTDTSAINSNIITRAVGADRHLTLDADVVELRCGDRFLLCSDGLNRELDDAGIARILQAGSPGQASRTLVNDAVSLGGGDNITALVAEYQSPRMDGAAC